MEFLNHSEVSCFFVQNSSYIALCWKLLKSVFYSDHGLEEMKENTIQSPLPFNNVRRILNEKAAAAFLSKTVSKFFHEEAEIKL